MSPPSCFFCKLYVSSFWDSEFSCLTHLIFFKVLESQVLTVLWRFSHSEGKVRLWGPDRKFQSILVHEQHGKGSVLAFASAITTYRANSSARPPKYSTYSVTHANHTLISTDLVQCSQLYLANDESFVISYSPLSFFSLPPWNSGKTSLSIHNVYSGFCFCLKTSILWTIP